MADTKVYVNTSSSGGTTGANNNSGTAFQNLNAALTYAIANKSASDKWTIICSAPSGVDDDVHIDSISGLATNSTGYLHVRPNRGNEGGTVADQRHYGIPTTGIYRLTGNGPIAFESQYIRFTGLQVIPNSATATCPRAFQIDVDNIKIERCIVQQHPSYVGAGTDNVNWGLRFGASSTSTVICNNIFIGFNCTGAYSVPGVAILEGGGAKFFNNTIANCLRGMYEAGAGATIKNNLVYNCSVADWVAGGWGYSTVDYNASKDASAPGTHARASQTFTFVNTGISDFRIAAADAGANAHGVDASGVADWTDVDGFQNGIIQDINEITRSSTWSIGASEPVGAAVPTSISLDSPTTLTFYQQNGSDQADIPISLTSNGDTQEVEARFNGGSWASIGTTDSGGNLSGTLTDQDAGVGLLEIRFVDYTDVNDSVDDIGIGDVTGGATDPRRVIIGFLS